MLGKAGSGHPGGSLSAADIVTSLFFKVMRHNPQNPDWPDRDRFHMSKGHCCPLWYAVLAESGYFDKEKLLHLRQ
ncbi:MAG: transketolase, partial [Candidatus Omnitrophota bacterium]